MQKKIPAGLLPEIADRHRAGQRDQAITDWLAQLTPPIMVSLVAVLGARRTATGQPAKPRAAKTPPATSTVGAAVASMGRTKATGAQNRKAAAAQNTQSAIQHVQRGVFCPPISE